MQSLVYPVLALVVFSKSAATEMAMRVLGSNDDRSHPQRGLRSRLKSQSVGPWVDEKIKAG